MIPKLTGFPQDFPSISFYTLDLDEVDVRTNAYQCYPVHYTLPKPICTPVSFDHMSLCFPTAGLFFLSLQDIGDELNMSVLPTFILYQHGKEIHRIEGVPQQRPARVLAKAISCHLLTADANETNRK